jgi:type I restriction enzyme S subunit
MEENQVHIPDGWKLNELGNLIKEQKKSSLKVSDAANFGEFPFFTSGEAILKHASKQLDGKNIFLATGGVANIKYNAGDAAYSTDTYAITTKDEIDTEYLYFNLLNILYYINANYFQGSGLKHLQKKDLKKHQIFFPENPTEQTTIARILSKVDEAIPQTEQLIAKYTRIKTGLMQDLLTKGIDEHGNIRSEATHEFKDSPLGRIPKEWECDVLNSIMLIIDCKHITPNYVEEGYPLIRPRNIKPNGISMEDMVYVGKADFKMLMDKHLPKSGDIVLTRNASFGVSSFIDEFIDFAIGQDVVIMTTNRKDIDTFFIFLLLNSVLLIQIINKSAGSTFGRINLGLIRKLITPVPNFEEQQRISGCIRKLDETLDYQKNSLAKLQSLKTGLMQDLLSGKVRVNHLIKQTVSV